MIGEGCRISDPKSVLAGVYKILKLKGQVIIQMGGYGNAKNMLISMKNVMALDKFKSYFTEFTFPYTFPSDEEYEALLQEVGFSDYKVCLISKDMIHDDIDAFKGWITTTWFPYIKCVPKVIEEEFINTFIDIYLEYMPLDTQGKIHVDMVRLEVNAKK